MPVSKGEKPKTSEIDCLKSTLSDMGYNEEEIALHVQCVNDLATFYNITTDEAVKRLRGV